ncbi:MAG TPA: tRNA (guanosine(37)-N1)-methyltransferase TrmD [SAR86 cluster bacterium]|nr:tRNA (guanosine(37)-N1)-methyltransferase TrmD [SAR86 cluster bacterium]|tara:strand:- start:7886 stop:8614 length:729 start_codon:yes stop_codon:yes gene_type:complete
MKFEVVTIFPELINEFITHGIISKAITLKKLSVNTWNPRDYSEDKGRRLDDKPYGGGPGMLLQAEPLIRTIDAIKKEKETHVVYMAPHGKILDQERVIELSSKENITIISGRYEGIDQRVEDSRVDEVCSVGDFVLNGGEVPALVLIESISRLINGVLGDMDSIMEESFSDGLLEFPQFTRPKKSAYGDVPEILLGGNHSEIKTWRLKESLRRTLTNRPDLLKGRKLTEEEKELIDEINDEN